MLLGCLLLSACSSAENLDSPVATNAKQQADFSPMSLISAPPTGDYEVPLPESVFALNQAQQHAFLDYYHASENQHLPGHKRLFAYLENSLVDFTFLGDTYDAQTALTAQAGNFLSLAIVTTALAQLVDIDVTYQQVNSAPQSSFIVTYSKIQMALYMRLAIMLSC